MTTRQENRRRIPVLGLNTDLTDYDQAIALITDLARDARGGYVCVTNVHVAIEAEDDPTYRELVNNADLVLPDGTPLVWMQRWQGNENASQVRGPSLMPMLMEHSQREGLKVGFLGGRQEVLDKIHKRARIDFPNLDVAYSYSPPFRALSEDENDAIVDDINTAGVQILFVGLGCPKQERWIATHRERVRAVSIGVGAAFDLYAGDIHEAPAIVSRLGMEWMFRLIQEPRRLFSRYILVNPRFMWLAGKQLLRAKTRRS
ncbi:MAG TPA: WecB/TagA/CpsF family glycosyltransferase [Pyrinomonadaceae bacterium]|nr:WecB/TagA/CpsF family glycosyltransferase [Pyrinomonadaceae bacterium]